MLGHKTSFNKFGEMKECSVTITELNEKSVIDKYLENP